MQSSRAMRAQIKALERQLEVDQQALNSARALLQGMENMQRAKTRAELLVALSHTLRATTSAEEVYVLTDATEGTFGVRKTRMQMLHPPGVEQIIPPEAEGWLSKPRHLKDLSRTRNTTSSNGILPHDGSLISTPFWCEDNHLIAVACWHSSVKFFGKDHLETLQRLTKVLAQSLDNLRLNQRHALLGSVIENSVLPMMIVESYTMGGEIVFVNRAFEDKNRPKLDNDEPAYAEVGQRFLKDEFGSCPELRNLRDAYCAGRGGRFRLRSSFKSNQTALEEINLTPIRDADGTLRYMLITLVDLTRLAESQREIQRLEDHIESAMESVSGGIMVTAPTGEVLYSNSVMHELLHQVYGTEMRPHQAMRAFYRKVTQDKRSFEVGCNDGRLFLVRNFASREGGLVITATDVTEIKQAERALKQRAAAMDSTTEGIAIVTKAAKITYANPAFAQISGAASPDTLIGESWCSAFCAEDVSRLGSEVRPLVETQGSGRIEMRICANDEDGADEAQSKRTFDVCVTRIDDQMRIVVARDITRRIEYETSRANLEQKLHDFEKNESIGRLAAGVAHDFNNLLAVINGHAALLNERTPPDKVQLYSDRISAASSRAAKMINRFLDLGMSADSDSMIDFRNLMTESQDLLKSALSADTGFSLKMADEEMEMLCCPSDLLRVALNLIQNAQDALEGKPGAIHQSLTRHLGADIMDLDFSSGSIDPEQGYACYSVRDTGSGIPPDICRRLFREHCSTKGQRGSGIGMMAVAEIIRNHEGAIRLTSIVGEGTTVEIYLPLSDFMISRVDDGEIGSVRLEGQLVLLVDDDVQVAESIGAFLERLGAEVSICHHPEEALEAITEDPGLWSILVSDYNMPGQNGGQLAKAAKGVDPDLPVIIVTALARKLSDPNLNEDVITALLGKPVDLNRLAHVIAQNGRSIPQG